MPGCDYSRPGWYFVTLGADYHRHMFGTLVKGVMRPNALGYLVEQSWAEIPSHYGHIMLGAMQVMPNHFHGLIRIINPVGKGLGEVIRARLKINWVFAGEYSGWIIMVRKRNIS